ncbi:MAG: NAD(P)-dependent oxidoreductase [Rhodospirillales bacterium]|nr:NAD(P)-dependent oxidoreductase [Rhodospirillales bacterium]
MRRALVTGATSYPGQRLLARLMAEGIEVHALVRMTSDLARFDPLPHLPVIHPHDGSYAMMHDIMAETRPDIVFHLASHYVREHKPEQIDGLIESNLTFGLYLLEAMRQTGVPRLVNVGTFAQFYESADYRPLSLYAATKQAFEDLLAYYVDLGLAATTLIFFDTYGPYDWRPRLVNALLDAWVNNTQLPLPESHVKVTLDLVYIDDAIEALWQAGRHLMTDPKPLSGRRFAIGSGDWHTLRQVVELFEQVSGREIIKAWGMWPLPDRHVVTPWEGPNLPGWRPKVGLAEGLKRCLEARGHAG